MACSPLPDWLALVGHAGGQSQMPSSSSSALCPPDRGDRLSLVIGMRDLKRTCFLCEYSTAFSRVKREPEPRRPASLDRTQALHRRLGRRGHGVLPRVLMRHSGLCVPPPAEPRCCPSGRVGPAPTAVPLSLRYENKESPPWFVLLALFSACFCCCRFSFAQVMFLLSRTLLKVTESPEVLSPFPCALVDFTIAVLQSTHCGATNMHCTLIRSRHHARTIPPPPPTHPPTKTKTHTQHGVKRCYRARWSYNCATAYAYTHTHTHTQTRARTL
jgi:hypothetical protein